MRVYLRCLAEKKFPVLPSGREIIAMTVVAAATALGGQFSQKPWNSDLDCGVSAVFNYTCAININGIASADVNGVPFTGVSSLNSSGTGYSLGGFTGSYTTDDPNTVIGRSRELAKRFHYNGNPAAITFSGLTSGTVYRATLFSVGWDAAPGERNILFSCGSDSLLVNQNTYGDNNGIRIDYEYVADGSGSITINAARDAPNNKTFHLYAFCNCEKKNDLYIDNGSFEWPVIAGNGGVWEYQNQIGGWSQSGNITDVVNGRIGLTANAQPWAGDAAFPDGNQVVFIQNSTSNTESLVQNVVNLTSGQTYRVSYRYAARVGSSGQTDPNIKVTINDSIVQDTLYRKSLGAGSPFFLGTYEFAATGTTANIIFENTRLGYDTAVLLDDLQIEPAGGDGWMINLWTNDATAGIVSSAHYTHAINLGDSAATTISNISFKGSGTGINPAEGVGGANYSTVYGIRYSGVDSNALTANGGGSAILAQRFCYDGRVAGTIIGFTLNGLIPGQRYETTTYGVAWDVMPASRCLAFSVNGSPEVTFNENVYGNDNGVRLTYRGIADTNGTITVDARMLFDNWSFHTYGFANKAEPDADIVLADTFAGHNGADNSMNIAARAPDHVNLFLSGTYTETGMNGDFHTDIQNGTARLGANAGAAIRIHDSNGHLKPAVMRIQADLKTGNLTSTGSDYGNARGVGLGFYSQGDYTDNLEVATGFTGLVLAPNGDLYLFQNGTYSGDANRIAFGGTFDSNVFYTLSYEVNVDSGTIANIDLEGSTNSYAVIESAASGFGPYSTAMAGFSGSSSAAGTFGYADTLVLTELVPGVPPPPGTLILIH